jgi:hypothetical protein
MFTWNKYQNGSDGPFSSVRHGKGFSMIAKFTNLADTYALLTENSYVAMAAVGTVECLSAHAADTAANGHYVTVHYVDREGMIGQQEVGLNGASAVELTSSIGHIFAASLRKKSNGNITVREKSGVGTLTITAGRLETQILHVYGGKDYPESSRLATCITFFEVALSTTDDDVTVEIREYPESAPNSNTIMGIRDITQGYAIRDQFTTNKTAEIVGYSTPCCGIPIQCNPGSYVAVIAKSAAGTADGIVRVKGFAEG